MSHSPRKNAVNRRLVAKALKNALFAPHRSTRLPQRELAPTACFIVPALGRILVQRPGEQRFSKPYQEFKTVGQRLSRRMLRESLVVRLRLGVLLRAPGGAGAVLHQFLALPGQGERIFPLQKVDQPLPDLAARVERGPPGLSQYPQFHDAVMSVACLVGTRLSQRLGTLRISRASYSERMFDQTEAGKGNDHLLQSSRSGQFKT